MTALRLTPIFLGGRWMRMVERNLLTAPLKDLDGRPLAADLLAGKLPLGFAFADA